MSTPYPVMLRLAGRTCAVVGGGAVASRKVAGLLAAGAAVIVISPALHPDLEAQAAAGAITLQRRAYTPGLLADMRPLLVFAAADDPAVNQQVAEEARALGALVDVVDSGEDSDFTSAAVVQRGTITIAISTGGGSPALAAHLRAKTEAVIGAEYGVLSHWLADLRPVVRADIDAQPARASLWRRIIESSVLDDLRRGDLAAARARFDQLIAGDAGDNSEEEA